MPNTNASFSPFTRSDALNERLEALSTIEHHLSVQPELEAFDVKTLAILTRLYGADHQYLQVYRYAVLGEAEALVNLPESAQEPQARDRLKTGLQQRRQALLGMLMEMQDMENKECVALTGEDREDPPSV